jgi:hypothetical protein
MTQHMPNEEAAPLDKPWNASSGVRFHEQQGGYSLRFRARKEQPAQEANTPCALLARGVFYGKEPSMIQKRPGQVVITTSKGQVIVARRLFDRLEGKLKPDDLSLLRSYEWWVQLSELIVGIQVAPKTRHTHENATRRANNPGRIASRLGAAGARRGI